MCCSCAISAYLMILCVRFGPLPCFLLLQIGTSKAFRADAQDPSVSGGCMTMSNSVCNNIAFSRCRCAMHYASCVTMAHAPCARDSLCVQGACMCLRGALCELTYYVARACVLSCPLRTCIWPMYMAHFDVQECMRPSCVYLCMTVS